MDTIKSTRKHDQMSTTKNATFHCPNEEKMQSENKKKKKIDERPEEDEERPKDSKDYCVTKTETDEGSKPNSDCDQDSDVFFP